MGGGGLGDDEISDALEQLGKTSDDLSVAFAGTQSVALVAYRIRGVPATQFFQMFLAAAQADSPVTVTDQTITGKAAKKLVSDDPDIGTVYMYATGDVMIIVGGDEITDAIVQEAFSKLP